MDRKKRAERKFARVMSEFKRGELRSSSGELVRSRRQALAIAMSESERVLGR